MDRWWLAVVAALVVAASGTWLLTAPAPAGASSIYVKVSPDRNLSHGEWVTVSGHGLPRVKGQTWFVDQCTAAVRRRMNPATDTQHCDLTAAKVLKMGRHDSFSTRYRIITGIVGDGYCGTPGHLSCVLSIADAAGGGTVVKIQFRAPAPHPTMTTTTKTSTTSTTTTTTTQSSTTTTTTTEPADSSTA